MIIIYTTFPSKEKAEEISEILVKEKLAACVNIFPSHATYRWKEKIEKQDEFVGIIKTSRAFEEVSARLREVHPHKVACILEIEVKKGDKPYLDWVDESVR